MIKNKVTIRSSCNKRIKGEIMPCLTTGMNWMKKRYPDVNFNNVEFIFSSGYNRSRYFRNDEESEVYKKPTACIATFGELLLYKKYSLGIRKDFDMLYVGSEIQMITSIIHELTHHVQHEQNHRVGNELDTTRNELEYLKEFEPEIYSQIVNN